MRSPAWGARSATMSLPYSNTNECFWSYNAAFQELVCTRSPLRLFFRLGAVQAFGQKYLCMAYGIIVIPTRSMVTHLLVKARRLETMGVEHDLRTAALSGFMLGGLQE